MKDKERKFVEYIRKNCPDNIMLLFDCEDDDWYLMVRGNTSRIAELLYDHCILTGQEAASSRGRSEVYNVLMMTMTNLVMRDESARRDFLEDCERLKGIIDMNKKGGS